jgi:autotransporter translocation and assembly factor TamB
MRVKKLLKIVAYTLLGFVGILLLLAGITQTQIFRDGLRSYALAKLDSVLNAEVQLGSITGNLISGFSVDHLSIKVGRDFLVVADRFDIRYDLFEIPGKTISIDNITLVHPQIALLRGRDSVWNFERMIKPTPDDTTAKSPFDWTIRLQHLTIDNGTIEFLDSATLAEPDHPADDPYYVEYHRFGLTQFNLQTSLRFGKEGIRAVLTDCRFVSGQPDITLKRLTGDFNVTKTFAEVKNMVLQTGRSNLSLDVSMKNFDLLGGVDLPDLQKKPVRLSLRAHDIDLNELKRFIQPIGFLGSHIALDLDANGEFGNLQIAQLHLKSGETEFNIAGTLSNLHTPKKLYLDTRFEQSTIYSPDVLAILPEFDLPDLEALGRTRLNLTFTGEPLDFRSHIDIETDAGHVQTDGTLAIGGPYTLHYDGTVLYNNLNLAPITGKDELTGALNGSAKIAGRGVSLDSLRASLEIQIDSARLAGRTIAGTYLRVDAADRKLSAHTNLALGSMRGELAATLDRRSIDKPAFSVDGSVSSMNMEEVMLDPKSPSDLNFTINARGTGLTWESFNGDFLIGFRPSRYKEYGIDSSVVHLSFDQRNHEEKQLSIRSNIADFTLTGAFDTEYLKDLISYEMLSLRKAVGEKFVAVDSSFASGVGPAELAELENKLSPRTDRMNTTFSLVIKDLDPVSVVTSNRPFYGTGTLSGSLQGGFHDLAIQAQLLVDGFGYGSADSGVLIRNASVTLDVGSLKPHEPLKDLSFKLLAHAGRFLVNRSRFDSVLVDFRYEQEYSNYSALVHYSNDSRISIEGISTIAGDYLDFTLNSLSAGYKDFVWKADKGVTIGFGPRGVRVDNLVARRDSQTVTVAGTLAPGSALAASVSATNINLDDLKYLMPKEELNARSRAFAGIANLTLKAGGTLNSPQYDAALTAGNVSFRSVMLGDVTGTFRYLDRSLSTRTEVRSIAASDTAKPELLITGNIPVNLAFGAAEDEPSTAPMSLDVRSAGVDIGILDPILPTFNDLRGLLTCNVHVGGDAKRPQYSGTMSLTECTFLFVPNLINYSFEGNFRLAGDRIQVVQATAQSNLRDDQFRRSGLIHLTGDFALIDFRPSDFNLTAKGGLLVVRESTRRSTLSVYGNLFIETDDSGLRFTGEIERSLLRGRVIVNNSSLIFPPTEQVVDEKQSTTVPVRIVDDTTKVTRSIARPLAERYFGTGTRPDRNRGSRTADEAAPSRSFVDGIRYDLAIECTGGNTEIKLVFNAATGEELDANISGRFAITDDGKRWIGAMTIDRAYYRFIKQFDATGTIKYSGDFMNPELDIVATYSKTRVSQDTTAINKTENIVVSMKITGTRKAPKLEWSMTIDDVDYNSYRGAKSSDVQTDALAFILADTFPLSRSQANDLAADLGPTARSSLLTGATSLFTNALSEFVRTKTGFIHSIELSYGTQSSVSTAADIRLTGSVGAGMWRYGGKILNDPFQNANISLLYSVGEILERPALRNFMFELERRVELNTIGELTDRKQVNSAKLFYRFSF